MTLVTLFRMPPTLELRNARIWTADPNHPWASSLTIRQGRVVAVDAHGTAERIIDAEGRTVTPGLIDAHQHTLMGGQSLVDLDLYGLPADSLDTYRGRVRAVTTLETARLARELLHPDRVAIVVVGPAGVLRGQLEGLGPIDVVEP